MCELNARKEKKGEKIPSFANSMGQSKLLAKLSIPLPTELCQQPSLPCWRR
jgi:hypothetical protein